MPFFARRRLQAMLNDLSGLLTEQKALDLLHRLEDKRVEQVLPAEAELALLWALSQLGPLEIEPAWWGDNRRPDAYTEQLFEGLPAAIEIAATNDNTISGEAAMDAVALAISNCSNKVRKGTGAHLYFSFREESGYNGGRYFRRVLAPTSYEVSESVRQSISSWLLSGESMHSRLRICEPGLDVEIQHTKRKQTRFHNVWSSMPPEVHSLTKNPLFDVLKRKLAQLKAADPKTKRVIFLADVGSTLLNRLGDIGEIDITHRRVSAREIITHFVTKNADRIDFVVVFSPKRQSGPFGGQLRWSIWVFSRPGLDGIPPGLELIGRVLPSPRYEGYQVRSLFRQGVFSPGARGQYIGTMIEGGMNIHRIKVPARAFLDLMAGRITSEQFYYFLGERNGEKNLFKHWLDLGMTLKNASIAPRDIDQDDDHLILEFEDDPSARPLRLSEKTPTNP